MTRSPNSQLTVRQSWGLLLYAVLAIAVGFSLFLFGDAIWTITCALTLIFIIGPGLIVFAIVSVAQAVRAQRRTRS
jgi:uncharacterized membrane protein HdeD (DUF308 family)